MAKITRVFPKFSEEDKDLGELKWWSCRRGGYAVHCFSNRKKISAHRVVLSRILKRSVVAIDICDHINRDRLDNRRENIRLTDRRGNSQNKRGKNGEFRGVTFHKGARKFQSVVGMVIDGKRKSFYLGLFSSREEAAAVARAKRLELGFLGEV